MLPLSVELMLAGIPIGKSALGTGMERGPEPLLAAGPDVAAGAAALLVDASAALCACFSGDGSSSMMGLHLQLAVSMHAASLHICSPATAVPRDSRCRDSCWQKLGWAVTGCVGACRFATRFDACAECDNTGSRARKAGWGITMLKAEE